MNRKHALSLLMFGVLFSSFPAAAQQTATEAPHTKTKIKASKKAAPKHTKKTDSGVSPDVQTGPREGTEEKPTGGKNDSNSKDQ